MSKSERNFRKLLVSAFMGNALEFYEFGLYGLLSYTIMQSIFPLENPYLQSIVGMTVFALGYIARPLGGILFGHLGDRMGRRHALSLTMMGMAVVTCCIGLLPTYEQIGLVAITLLIILRFLQGISTGGEYTGALLIVLENRDPKRHCFYTALINGAGNCGFFLAAFMVYLAGAFSGTFGWRFPFLISAVLCVIGYYIRRNAFDGPEFEKAKIEDKILKRPLLGLLKHKKRNILCAIAISWPACIGGIIVLGYFPTYFVQVLGLEHEVSKIIIMISLFIYIILIYFFGMLLDKFNVFKAVKLVNALLLVATPPMFLLFSTHQAEWIFVGLLIFIGAVSGFCCSMPILVKLFPVAERYSGIGFSYGISAGVFGSTTPLVNTMLVTYTGLEYAPAFYLIFIALVGLVGTRYAQKIVEQPKEG